MKYKLTVIIFALCATLCLLGISACKTAEERHLHTYSDKFSYDETYHWQQANCGHDLVYDKQKHTFNNEMKCIYCGYGKTVDDTDDPDNTDKTVSIIFDANGGIWTDANPAELQLAKGSKLTPPSEPQRTGYDFIGWAINDTSDLWNFIRGEVSEDTVLHAVWQVKTFTVTFIAENITVLKTTVNYGATLTEKDIPAVPAKKGYSGSWDNCDFENITASLTVNADYTLNVYRIYFVAGGEIVSEQTFTVEKAEIEEPAVPSKKYYTGKWENYVTDAEDVTVNAIYEAIEYTVTFIADGKVIYTAKYTVEDRFVAEPAVPAKENCTGVWEEYELNCEDIIVSAVYSEV